MLVDYMHPQWFAGVSEENMILKEYTIVQCIYIYIYIGFPVKSATNLAGYS